MKRALLVVLLALATVLIAQNTEVVAVRFLFWEAHLSRVVLLMLTLTLGILIGITLGMVSRRKAAER